MPLVQSVPGLRAQDPGRLLLLEVPDEGHGSVCAGQVVAPWGGGESRERCLRMDEEKETETELLIQKLKQLTLPMYLSRSEHFLLCKKESSKEEETSHTSSNLCWCQTFGASSIYGNGAGIANPTTKNKT